MQDIDALKKKSLAELRQIAQVLGINESLKKNDLINKIMEVAATPGDNQNKKEDNAAPTKKRGPRQVLYPVRYGQKQII